VKKSFKVAVIQSRVSFSVRQGESQVLKFVKKAKSSNVDLLGLPEDCICGLFKHLKNYDPIEFLSKIAKDYRINLFGSNATIENGKYRNSGVYISKEGKLISKVNKIILAQPEKDIGFSPGDRIEIFNTEFGKMAILICKDAFNRYSSTWLSKLKNKKVEYILVPSMPLRVDNNSVDFWLNSLWLLARWFDIYIFDPGTVGKNYTQYHSFGRSLIVGRDKGFLKKGSKEKEELLLQEISIRSEKEIKKDYSLKWDPIKEPKVEIKKAKSYI
jgi:predicted amidohydrolase